MGNKTDVSGNDLVEYWEDDPDTEVILMYLESFGNPRRFPQIARRVTRKKPILTVKSGRTAEGARAASSHTGSIVGADVPVSPCSSSAECCGSRPWRSCSPRRPRSTAAPAPRGKRVAIVTNAGGPAILCTDACVNLGLEIAALSQSTLDALAAFLPPEASIANPIDMIASATPEGYSKALRAILADEQVDMVMVINVRPLLTNPIDVMQRVGEAVQGQRKPVVAVMMATEEFHDEVRKRNDLPPVYEFPESALEPWPSSTSTRPFDSDPLTSPFQSSTSMMQPWPRSWRSKARATYPMVSHSRCSSTTAFRSPSGGR